MNPTAAGFLNPTIAQAINPSVMSAIPKSMPAAPNMPGLGLLPGQLFLNPAIAPKVKGNARPFAMGEYLRNPSGSTSNEMSVMVQDPNLNGGRPTIVPSLWLIDGKPHRVDEDTAARLAAQSGLQFQSFDTIDTANKFAEAREANWQTLAPDQAAQVQALWSMPERRP